MLVLVLTTSLFGCNWISTTTSGSDIIDFHTQTGDLTTEDILTTETPNTDDVAFDTLFDDTVYKRFVISFSRDNFLKLIDDMENYHDEFGSYRDNTIQEVDITYTDSDGNVMTINEVGFRTKGNIFSRILPVIKEGDTIVGYQQVAFQLEFNATFEYTSGSTEYNSLKSREVFSLEQLNFKHVREGDTGVVTESVAYDLYREAGVITSDTSYAIIYFDIDGEVVPYGLFMLQEPIDDVFVERYFGKNQDSTIGDLYKCTWQTEPASLKSGYEDYSLGISDYMEGFRRSYALKTNKDEADFTAFTNFVNIVNQTSVANYYDLLATTLEMDAFAKAFAMGFLIGSPDDFRSNANNYYLYFNNNHVYYIPFDMDNSMGYGWNPYGDFGITLDVDSIQPSNWSQATSDMVLVYYLMEDPEFRDLYLGYLNDYTQADGLFDYDMYQNEFLLIKSLYQEEILEFNHLGIHDFTLNNRWITASQYYLEKTTNVRSQLEELGYQ